MSCTLRDFHNRLRVLTSLDRPELVDAKVIAQSDHNAWGTFVRDPFRWFIRADDETVEKLWALIEKRASRSTSPFQRSYEGK